MVNQFIDKFNKIFIEVQEKKKEIFLFMLLKTDEAPDKWSVFISAFWDNTEEKKEMFAYLTSLIKKSLVAEELAMIARIGIFDPSSGLVKLITDMISTEKGIVRIQETTINGFLIHDAYIFKSLKPVLKEERYLPAEKEIAYFGEPGKELTPTEFELKKKESEEKNKSIENKSK